MIGLQFPRSSRGLVYVQMDSLLLSSGDWLTCEDQKKMSRRNRLFMELKKHEDAGYKDNSEVELKSTMKVNALSLFSVLLKINNVNCKKK